MIGTLNEGSLHAQIKAWYRRPGDLVEHPVDGYVIDLVRGETLIEIQTGGFAPLRRKLDRLLEEHPVRLVVPVALERRIVRLSRDGEILSARRSPKHGRPEDVFARLVSLPGAARAAGIRARGAAHARGRVSGATRPGARSAGTAGS